MTTARAICLFALAAIAAGSALPERGWAQALGGAPAYARSLDRSPYYRRGTVRANPAPRSITRRQPGFFSRLFGLSPSPRGASRSHGWGGDQMTYRGRGYRTLCVRMCDGYYWPLSFSTASSGLRGDAARCENSCSAPAKLFYERSPGGNAEAMIDLEGKRYADLPNAFRYREEYVENCRCKPEPWSAEARAEYEARADQHLAEAAAKPEDGEASAAAAAPARPAARRYTRRPPHRPRRRQGWDQGGIFSAWR